MPPAGVSHVRETNRYRARYKDTDGNEKTVGSFATEEEAAHAYNDKLRALGLDSVRRMNAVDEQGRLVAKPKASSSFYGVSWNRGKKKWSTYVKGQHLGDKGQHLGDFDDETAAACAVDDYLYELHQPDIATQKANFPRA